MFEGRNLAVAQRDIGRGDVLRKVITALAARDWHHTGLCHRPGDGELGRCTAFRAGQFVHRTLALPDAAKQWSLTTLREKLVKIGAKIVRRGRYVTFQLAEVAIPRDLFADILRRIDRLRPASLPT